MSACRAPLAEYLMISQKYASSLQREERETEKCLTSLNDLSKKIRVTRLQEDSALVRLCSNLSENRIPID